MSANGRRKRDKGPKFHPSSFGGWPDYQQWADNDFRPCPEPEPEPVPEPEPARKPVAPYAHIAMTMWAGKPVGDPPPPPVEPEPLSGPDWQAFAEVEFEPEPEPVPKQVSPHAHIAMTMWAGKPVRDLPSVEPEPVSGPDWQAFGEPAPKPVSSYTNIAMTMWAGKPVADPPLPVDREPLSTSGWQAFVAANPPPVASPPPLIPTRRSEGPDSGPHWADDDLVVRPYVRTHGRVTQGYDLRLETLVSVTRPHEHDPLNPAFTQDVLSIRNLCRAAPQSVAEVSSYLNTPLGVARVLIADAIEAGLVTVDHATAPVDVKPTRELLERIRDGLRELV